jgi:4-amino-4-deoxy-L-arabinose transferase-like glycosyltransferase
VALLLPVLGIGAFLLYTDNMRQVLQELQLFWGSLVVILIALPWFAIESLIHGKTYLNAFFSYRTFFDPFTRVIDHHHSPSYFYFLIVLLGFLPFSIYLPVAIARLQVWRVRAWRSQPRAAQLGPFAVCWFACIFCFFTVAATKLPNFVLPLMPAAAILVVLLWSEQIATIPATRTIPDSLGFTLSSLANTAFLGLLALASWQLPQLIGPDSAAPLLPQAIRQANLPLLWGSIWTVAAVVGGLLVLRLQQQWLWLVNLVALIAFAIVAVAIAFPIVDIQRQQPLRELSQYAAREFHPGEAALMVGFWKPSVVFYMQHPVHFVAFPADLPQEIDRIAAEQPFTESMLILGEGASLAETGLQPNQYRKLSQAGAFQLMRVNVPLVDR